jgi:hypothetical protein
VTEHNRIDLLGSAYSAEDVISVLREVLDDQSRSAGPDHPRTLTAREDLAEALLRAGRRGEAGAVYQTLHADLEQILGSGHPATVAIRATLDALARP